MRAAAGGSPAGFLLSAPTRVKGSLRPPLFFISPVNTIMAVDVHEKAEAIEFGAARPVFRAPIFAAPRWRYDVAPDGRFLVLTQEEAPAPLRVMSNWRANAK